MSLSSEVSPTEPYSYWFRRSAYLGRTKPNSSEIQHYDPVSQTWKVENRIRYIEWLSQERVSVPQYFANNLINQWKVNRGKH